MPYPLRHRATDVVRHKSPVIVQRLSLTLVKSRYLSPKHKKIADPVIHRNAYFAHPENLLLAMMTDHRPHIRELGLRRVMKARAADPVDKYGGSRFPQNWTYAVEYFDMTDWAVCPISEPPIIKALTYAELRELITSNCQLPKIPLPHTGCGKTREADRWQTRPKLFVGRNREMASSVHASKRDLSNFTL